jgi:hypothetical protein
MFIETKHDNLTTTQFQILYYQRKNWMRLNIVPNITVIYLPCSFLITQSLFCHNWYSPWSDSAPIFQEPNHFDRNFIPSHRLQNHKVTSSHHTFANRWTFTFPCISISALQLQFRHPHNPIAETEPSTPRHNHCNKLMHWRQSLCLALKLYILNWLHYI